MNRDGISVDEKFRKGARAALEYAILSEVDIAVLQSRSPSCGVRQIYDGSFSGNLVPGSGIFASMLSEKGIRTIDIENLRPEELG